MQAMILAAGLGKRMLPLTHTTPKPMLMLKGQPIIVHLLQSLKNNGVNKVVINLYHHKEQIKTFLQNGNRYGLEILYSEEKELLNTGGGIVNALPLLGTEPFIVVSADIYSVYQFATLPQKLTGLAHLVLVDNPLFNSNGDFALQNGQVYLSGDKMLTYASIGIFKREFFDDPPGSAFPLHILLKRAINNNMVTGERFTGTWHNIGTKELLQAAEAAEIVQGV
jgi:MurNAc alpha-1-phosphate uridylyltransferase